MANEVFRTSVPDPGTSVVLLSTCPSCGQEVPPGHRFCGHCGFGMGTADFGLDGAECVLVRSGTDTARVVPEAGCGPVESVAVQLMAVSDHGDPVFGLERDKYVLFDTSGGSPRVTGCPFGRTGFCSENGKDPCGDLGGWLCLRTKSGEMLACAALCRGAVNRNSFSY